jgi:hypothetical protein
LEIIVAVLFENGRRNYIYSGGTRLFKYLSRRKCKKIPRKLWKFSKRKEMRKVK